MWWLVNNNINGYSLLQGLENVECLISCSKKNTTNPWDWIQLFTGIFIFEIIYSPKKSYKRFCNENVFLVNSKKRNNENVSGTVPL